MRLKIRKSFDTHLHLRQGAMLDQVIRFTLEHFWGAVVEPNTEPPITDVARFLAYSDEIMNVARVAGHPGFRALVALYLTEETTPEIIKLVNGVGCRVIKVYPKHGTTGSGWGISWKHYGSVLFFRCMEMAERLGMVVQFHGEQLNGCCALTTIAERVQHISNPREDDISPVDRERRFIPMLDDLAWHLKGLKIVMEHVTTSEAVHFVAGAREGVAASITPHHLVLLRSDVVDRKVDPFAFCLPTAQLEADVRNLLIAACCGESKTAHRFFLGTDSAPHYKDKKLNTGCAGIFNSPVALAAVADVFDAYLDGVKPVAQYFENFVSVNGPRFYGLEPSDEMIEVVEDPWTVPESYGSGSDLASCDNSIVPFMAGKILKHAVRV